MKHTTISGFFGLYALAKIRNGRTFIDESRIEIVLLCNSSRLSSQSISAEGELDKKGLIQSCSSLGK